MADALTIKVLSGGGFPEREVNSTTVGALRTELEIAPGATVAVNGKGVTDNYELKPNDVVAAVTSDKRGGVEFIFMGVVTQ